MSRMRLFVLTFAALLLLQTAAHAAGEGTPYDEMQPYSYEKRFSDFSGFYQGKVGVSEGSTPDPPEQTLQGSLAFIITPGEPTMYWKTMTFDVFDGRRWYRSGYSSLISQDAASAPVGTTWLSFEVYKEMPTPGNYYLAYPANPFSTLNGNNTVAGARRDGYGDYQLFASKAGNLTYNVSYALLPYGNMVSSPAAGSGSLGAKEREIDLSRYPGFSSEVENLSSSLKLANATPLAQALHDASYIRSNFKYDLDWANSSEVFGQADLLSVLMENRKGVCIHYASLLAMVLRSQGVHSRLATGYAGGLPYEGKSYLISSYLHAWTEVYQPGIGWAMVDATPFGTLDLVKKMNGSGGSQSKPSDMEEPDGTDKNESDNSSISMWTNNGMVTPELRFALNMNAVAAISKSESGTSGKSPQGVGGQAGKLPVESSGEKQNDSKTKIEEEQEGGEQSPEEKGIDGQNETAPFLNDSTASAMKGKGGFQPSPDNPAPGNATPAKDSGSSGPMGEGNSSFSGSSMGRNESGREWDSLLRRFEEQARYMRNLSEKDSELQGELASANDFSGKLWQNDSSQQGDSAKTNSSSGPLGGKFSWSLDGYNRSLAADLLQENKSYEGSILPVSQAGNASRQPAAGAKQAAKDYKGGQSYDEGKSAQNLLAIGAAICIAALLASAYALSRAVPSLRANYHSLKQEESRKSAVMDAKKMFKNIDLDALIMEVEDLGSSGRHREAVLCAHRGFEDYLAFASKRFNYPNLTAREYSALLRDLPFHSYLETVVLAFEITRYTHGRVYEGQYARVLSALKGMEKEQKKEASKP